MKIHARLMTLLAGAIAAACSFDASGTTLREAAGAAPGYSFYSADSGSDYRYFWRCDGENGAKSGGCNIDGVNSWMDVVVQGPANITFDWKVESESGYDGLAFHDGNNQIDAISGGSGWRSRNYTISDSKAHVIRFRYYKDESCSDGSDCGWVKNFQVTRAADLLPDEYIQYVSLKTDGGAAINSGYSYVSGTRIDVEWVLDATSSFGGLSIPSGASTLTCQGANAYVCDGGAESSKVLSIGGTASGNSCPLFLLDKAGAMTPGDGEKIVGDIYSFRILDSNNVVQRNMIPCQRIADRVAGFYDTVGGGFYPSVTDAAFTAESRVGGYIITLDAQGGTGGTTGIKVMFGDMVPTIEVPTRSGFDFLGYFDENGTQYYDLAGYGVRTWDQDADVTLKASWDGDNTSLFLPPGDAGTKYVVSNLTAGVEVERFCETADGRVVYRLPVGVRASVSCAPSAGCFVVGTNPYVIDSVTAGMAVDAAVLPRGVTQTLLDLESILDTANTPTTAELVYDGNGVLVGHRVTLGQNYGPLTLAVDCGAVTIDLNGWMIRGTDGANASGDAPGDAGVAAVTIAGTSGGVGATVITVVNDTDAAGVRPASGSSAGIVGGNGGNGYPPGRGAYAFEDGNGAYYGSVVDTFGLATSGVGGLLGGVVADPTSTYVPTKAINGDLEEEPFMAFVQGGVLYTRENASWDKGEGEITEIFPNGVDGGWNTSENTRYGSSFYEWGGPDGWGSRDGHGHFMEMNANNPAVFWQDLTTYGGDVILWSVRHGARYDWDYFDQCIRVEVGAPAGVASGLWDQVDSNIKPETKVIYSYDGVQNPEGDVTYGYAGELEGLLLHDCPGDWSTVTGVYLIPEGQDVTRFAFLSILPNDSGAGNLLDDLTFSTLIGNLKAVANDDGSVTFTGYWGDADASKSLRIEFDGQKYNLDMSGVLNKNFTVTIPYSLIGGATVIDVYHEDYPQAKRSVIIQHPEQFTIVVEGTTFKAWCTNEHHSAATGCPHAGEDNAIVCSFVAEDRVYTGLPYVGASLAGETKEWKDYGLPLPELAFAVSDSQDFNEIAPTVVGSYTAKAMIRELTATDDFAITKAPLTVTADDKLAYSDGEVPAFTAVVTGFVNGETDTEAYTGAPAFECPYTTGSDLGSYAITPSVGTLASANYAFDFVPGVLLVVDHHLHCICCGEIESHGHSEVEWLPWTSATSLPTDAGNWYLTKDVELTAAYAPADGVNLCLNGHVVRQTASARVISVGEGVTFQLTDCNPSVEHKFSVDADGVWTLDEDSGVKTVCGGAITGGAIRDDNGGAGVCVIGTFNMYGGNIVGNRTLDYFYEDWWEWFYYYGGGVFVNGAFTMYDGAILGNRAGYGGGVAVRYQGSFVAIGGQISENSALNNGGAMYAGARFELTDVDVDGNSAGNEGGAIYTCDDQWTQIQSSIKDSRICNNTANIAAAIRLCYHNMTFENVTITNNVESNNGQSSKFGAVYVENYRTSLTVGGSTVIQDNLAKGESGNLGLSSDTRIIVSTATPLTADALIGVTTRQVPKMGNPVPVTTNRGEDYESFTSDDPAYQVVNEDNVVKLMLPEPEEIWQVGDNVWAYTNSVGTLYVYGSGVTWDYDTKNPPWYKGILNIKSAVIEDGVTEIGNRFFKKCYNMKSISCANSVVRIHERAFYLCTSLESIWISNWNFDMDCLKDAIVPRLSYDQNGNFILVPSVGGEYYQSILYGKRNLSDPDWEYIGPVDWQNFNDLKSDGTYHFFQTRLEWAGGGGA